MQFIQSEEIVKGRVAAEQRAAQLRAEGWNASVRFLFGLAYEVRMSRLA